MKLVNHRERLKAIETIRQELGIELKTVGRHVLVGPPSEDRHELDASDMHRVISALEALHAVITEPAFPDDVRVDPR